MNIESIKLAFLCKLLLQEIFPNSFLLCPKISSFSSIYFLLEWIFNSSCKFSNKKLRYSLASCCWLLLKSSFNFPTIFFKFFTLSPIFEFLIQYKFLKVSKNFPWWPNLLNLLIKKFILWSKKSCCRIGRFKNIWLTELK